MSTMRIAFITSEFATEGSTAGGLGTYMRRITRALCDAGHTPEVFVTSRSSAGTSVINGVTVHTVKVTTADRGMRKALNWLLVRLFREVWSGPAGYVNHAWHLSRAFHARERQVDFAFVQSTNCAGCGLLIRKKRGRPHLMRLSSKRDLWFEADGRQGPGFSAMSSMERMAAGRADRVYAPSRFLARECTEQWGIQTDVLRPPAFIDTDPAREIPCKLPARFMVHFGSFAARKGSVVLARALRRVWEQVPGFEMVWCGTWADDAVRRECRELFAGHAARIHLTGPLKKEVLYAVIRTSVAAVLPSRVDNLPNTVIESLLLERPVIGTLDSSIDELVQDRVTGLLVENNSEKDLADAIVRLWNNPLVFNADAVYSRPVFKMMEPAVAADSLACFRFEDSAAGR